MCGQQKIMNGRRWVCIREEHPDQPENHGYAAPWLARAAKDAKRRMAERQS